LPKFISECGDVLLFGFVSDYAGAVPGYMRLLLFLQVSLIGVLEGLSGAFMPGQVILLSVMLGAGAMGVGGKVTAFRSDPLRFVHNHGQSTRGAVCRAEAYKGLAARGLIWKVSPKVQDLLGTCRFHHPAVPAGQQNPPGALAAWAGSDPAAARRTETRRRARP